MPRPAKKTAAGAAKKAAPASPVDTFMLCMDLVKKTHDAIDQAPTVHDRRARLKDAGAAELLLEIHGSLTHEEVVKVAAWITRNMDNAKRLPPQEKAAAQGE